MEKGFIGVHAISEENLEKVIKRGGFIAPSIAYTTMENSISNFSYGINTIIFDENTFNPDIDSNHYLFSGDGYTSVCSTHITDDMPTEEIIEKMQKDMENPDISFLLNVDPDMCKARASERISLNQATNEVDRIVDLDTFEQVKEDFVDTYEAFLDNNFPGWDWSDKRQKYLFETPYLKKLDAYPNIEKGLQKAVRTAIEYSGSSQQHKQVKAACEKMGLRVTRGKIDKIIDFANYCRYMPICYFEAKVMRFVPLQEAKCFILQTESPLPRTLYPTPDTFPKSQQLYECLKNTGIPVLQHRDERYRQFAIEEYMRYKNADKPFDFTAYGERNEDIHKFYAMNLGFYKSVLSISDYDKLCEKLSHDPSLAVRTILTEEAGFDLRYKTREESIDAVKRNGYELRLVENQTSEICCLALKKNPGAIIYVKELTGELYDVFANSDYKPCDYLPVLRKLGSHITPEAYLKAVKQDPQLLIHDDVKYQTPEVCDAVVQELGKDVLKTIFRQSPTLCSAAIHHDISTIKDIRNLAETLKKFHKEDRMYLAQNYSQYESMVYKSTKEEIVNALLHDTSKEVRTVMQKELTKSHNKPKEKEKGIDI